MPAEAPFLFSVAGLSASLAGLAGLVAALRRNGGLRPIDTFRLREIVEFAFANMLISLSFVPLDATIGGNAAARIAGVGILAYLVGSELGLVVRFARVGPWRPQWWMLAAGATSGTGIVVAIVTAATGNVAALEITLILLLARPMISFLFVLDSLESSDDR